MEYLDSLKNLVVAPLRQQNFEGTSTVKMTWSRSLYTLAGQNSTFIRVAGLSGALAVGLGAYGAHSLKDKVGIAQERKTAFDAASRYHMLHTVALMGVPLCRYPVVTGSLFILGMTLFCGTCYYHALTGKTNIKEMKITPIGGILLILAWASMII